MDPHVRLAAALTWATRRGSALQALAIIGSAAAGVAWLFDRLTNTALLEAYLGAALIWGVGTWMQKH